MSDLGTSMEKTKEYLLTLSFHVPSPLLLYFLNANIPTQSSCSTPTPSTGKIQMFKRNWQCVSHQHVILRSISHL